MGISFTILGIYVNCDCCGLYNMWEYLLWGSTLGKATTIGLSILLAALSACAAPGRDTEGELRGPVYEVLKDIQRELTGLKHKYQQLEGIENACIGRSITHCSCRWNGSPKAEHWQVCIRLTDDGSPEVNITSSPPWDGGIEMHYENGLILCWFGVREHDPLPQSYFRNVLESTVNAHQLRILKRHDSLQEQAP